MKQKIPDPKAEDCGLSYHGMTVGLSYNGMIVGLSYNGSRSIVLSLRLPRYDSPIDRTKLIIVESKKQSNTKAPLSTSRTRLTLAISYLLHLYLAKSKS